jgi:hypothetical protein
MESAEVVGEHPRRRGRPGCGPGGPGGLGGLGLRLDASALSRHICDLSAGLAQLVERQLPKLNVVGSNPISRSLEPQ